MNPETYQLLGPYAIDAVNDHERNDIERYLAEHPEHLTELFSLRDAAAELSSLTETAPPPALRESVLSGIAQVRPLPPLEPKPESEPVAPRPAETADLASARHRRSERQRRFPGLLAAAAAVVIVAGGVGVTVWSPWQESPNVTIAQQVSSAPDARKYTLKLGNHQATVTRSTTEGKAVLHSDDLDNPPEGKTYQMWLQHADGRMASAGLLPRSQDGKVTMVLEGDAAKAVGAGMTLEPAGGSKQPTTTPLDLVTF